MIDGSIIGETEKAYNVNVPGHGDVWIGKTIVRDGIVPKWAMNQKGIDNAVKIQNNGSNNHTQENKETITVPNDQNLILMTQKQAVIWVSIDETIQKAPYQPIKLGCGARIVIDDPSQAIEKYGELWNMVNQQVSNQRQQILNDLKSSGD